MTNQSIYSKDILERYVLEKHFVYVKMWLVAISSCVIFLYKEYYQKFECGKFCPGVMGFLKMFADCLIK